MLPGIANTVLADFTDHRTPGALNAIYAHYGKAGFLQEGSARCPRLAGRAGKEYAYSSAGTELTAHILETVYKRCTTRRC